MRCSRRCRRTARAAPEAMREESNSTGGGLVAAVNNGSGNVALFRRDGDALKFDKVIQTTSAPLSVDFGNDHLYVAGATTVDSFVLHENSVEWLDGTTALAVAGGGSPAAGETSQVGVISAEQLLVTIKTDPNPGTVDVIALRRGRISGAAPTAVSAPQGSLAPFGFSTYPDGTALITLAHSDQDGLFRDGAVAAAAKIDNRLALWSSVQNAWYGLSLGSVLLLAAIGLAITFGVMGVINMAHGEMVMLGAYVTFVVQDIIRTSIPACSTSRCLRDAAGVSRRRQRRHCSSSAG